MTNRHAAVAAWRGRRILESLRTGLLEGAGSAETLSALDRSIEAIRLAEDLLDDAAERERISERLATRAEHLATGATHVRYLRAPGWSPICRVCELPLAECGATSEAACRRRGKVSAE